MKTTTIPRLFDRDLAIIYLLAVINAVFLMWYLGVQVSLDSLSYISACKDSYSAGHINLWRTPVYPVFLGLVWLAFPVHFAIVVIIIQNLFFLFSIWFFNDILKDVTSSRRIAFWITLLYALYPGIVQCGSWIMTESMAISLSVLIAHSFLALMKSGSWRPFIRFVILLALIVFLRPAQVYYLPVLMVVFLCLCLVKKQRTAGLFGTLGVAVVSLGVITYSGLFNSRYGVFTPSGIGVLNQLCIGLENGFISENNLKNKELAILLSNEGVEDPHSQGFVYGRANDIVDRFGIDVAADEVGHSMRAAPWDWARAALDRLKESEKEPLFINEPLGITLSLVYVFMLVFAVFLIVLVNKTRQIPWFMVTAFLLSAGNIAMAILGGQDTWGRLILPSVPFLLMMFGQFCSLLRVDSSRFSRIC